jgi:4-amino-4-deoxy-L-arabinose transferase-like glycosyltransferase
MINLKSNVNRFPVTLFVMILAIGVALAGLTQATFFSESLKRWARLDILNMGIYIGLTLLVFWWALRTTSPRLWILLVAFTWAVFLFGVGAAFSVVYLTLVAIVIGHRILLLTNLSDLDHNGFGLRAALGYSILIGIFQLTVFLPINTAGFVLIVTLPILLFQRELVKTLFYEISDLLQSPLKPDPSRVFLVTPVALLLVLLVYASYPESHSDALTVHLMIPHQVLVNARWSFDVSNFVLAAMPKGANWFFTIHYLLAGEPAARLANFLLTAYSAWLVFAIVCRIADRTAGALLAAVFLSAPLTSWVVFVAFEDALLSYVVLAALVILIEKWQNPTAGASFAIALLLSVAVATKMQGFFAAVPIFILLLSRMIWLRSFSLKGLSFSLIPVILIAAIPYASSAIMTGNPVFPMFNSVFKSPYFPPADFSNTQWSAKPSLSYIYDLTFHTSRFMEGTDGAFGLGHLLLLPGVLFASLFERRSSLLVPLVVTICFGLLLMPFIQYARYLYPTFATLAVASSVLYCQAQKEGWRRFMIIIFLGIIVFNLSLTRSLNAYYRFLLPNPLSAERPAQPAPVAELQFNRIINAEAGRDARVLYLGREYGAGLDGLPIYGNWMNPALQASLLAVKDQSDIINLIQKWNITYVAAIDEYEPKFANFYKWLPTIGKLDVQIGTSNLWSITPYLITPESEIQFNGTTAQRLIKTGGMTPENWGVWMRGFSAEWAFRAVNRPESADVLIAGVAMPFSKDLVVHVFAGNTAIGQLRFADGLTQQKWEILVPATAIGSDNIISLRFEFDPPAGCNPNNQNCFLDNPAQRRLGMIKFRVSYQG